MAKKGGKKQETTTTKKGPNLVQQRIKKARNCLRSAGKRGLDAFLAQNADIKSNPEVKRLIEKAGKLKIKPPKGQRGPKSQPRVQEAETINS